MPATASDPQLTVLVVGPEPAAAALAGLLARHGFAAVAAGGDDALAGFGGRLPDVAVVDLRMGGPELADRLRRKVRAAGKRPLLVAVADADPAGRPAGGFDVHLNRPVDPAELVGLLRRFERVLSPTADWARTAG